MTVPMFLALLLGFSIVTGLVVEAVKKFINDKENISYNIIALITAMIVGVVGSVIYYLFNSIPFTTNNIICMFLMGIASALVAMVGYDKVCQAITQLTSGKVPEVNTTKE